MEKLKIIFACVAVVAVFRTGKCYDLRGSYPAKTEYKPGESVSITCSGTKTKEEILTVLFLKVGYYIKTYSGATHSGEDNENYPMVIATNDQIDSDVQQKAPGRYTATGSHTDTEFDYTYTINGLKLEDYGNISCGVKVGEDGAVTPSSGYAQVKVLGPIMKMAILYKKHDESRTTLKNNPERDNPDSKITWVAEDEDKPGELACMVQYTTSPPTEWNVTLYDPYTKKYTDVKDKFRNSFPDGNIAVDGIFIENTEDQYFLSDAPTSSGQFGYKDSGKTLKFTCKVGGYDEVREASTGLDIQFDPTETSCEPKSPQAAVGTKNFTLLCYTRSNPEAAIAWTANNTDLRQGIAVQTMNKGPWQVSQLIIEEVQESDFTSYLFEAENNLGKVTYSGNGQTEWEIKKGTEVIQAPDADTWNPDQSKNPDQPKNPSKASVTSASGTLLALLALSLVLY